MLAAPFTILLELDLPLHLLFVLIGIVIAPFADGAGEHYEIFGPLCFCHEEKLTGIELVCKPRTTT
jgi:hypothetical protein